MNCLSETIKFYTYIWLREDGTPYYVGKGSHKRAFRKGNPKDSDRILIQEFATESDAFAAEIFLIDFYGRIDLGTGCLRNMTDGGDGGSNPSAEARRKRSEAHLLLWQSMTPEEANRRSRMSQLVRASQLSKLSQDELSVIAQKGNEKRKIANAISAKLWQARKTPEQRSASARKIWIGKSREERTAIRIKANRNRTKPPNRSHLRKPLVHGTLPGYSRFKCRCELCKTAWSDYWKNYRRQKRGQICSSQL